MSELHFVVLPAAQLKLWRTLTEQASFLQSLGYYLAGGTALALQLGHRRSVDFDFFSRRPALAGETQEWLEHLPGSLVRDIDRDTLHAEIDTVKLSFIGAYKYDLLETPVEQQGIRLASILDIGVMKLLAISHRATPRDYIDLAAIVQTGFLLSDLLAGGLRAYGSAFNPMVPLRALVSFDDLEGETPVMLDEELAVTWKDILRNAVRVTGEGV